MKREDWEKSTGKKFTKERRKIRHRTTRYRASRAYERVIDELGAYTETIEGRPDLDASARKSDNAALAAILKFGRRFSALYEAAAWEMNRRYDATDHGREVARIMGEIRQGIFIGHMGSRTVGEMVTAETIKRRRELKAKYKREHR